MTVKELRVFLASNNISDDAEVFVQRVEDVYFEKHGWETIKKPEAFFHGRSEYPHINEYFKPWCCVKYKEDNNLYIDAHY